MANENLIRTPGLNADIFRSLGTSLMQGDKIVKIDVYSGQLFARLKNENAKQTNQRPLRLLNLTMAKTDQGSAEALDDILVDLEKYLASDVCKFNAETKLMLLNLVSASKQYPASERIVNDSYQHFFDKTMARVNALNDPEFIKVREEGVLSLNNAIGELYKNLQLEQRETLPTATDVVNYMRVLLGGKAQALETETPELNYRA